MSPPRRAPVKAAQRGGEAERTFALANARREPDAWQTMNDAAYEREVLAWREARIARLTAPEGWLSLIGKVPLDDAELEIGSHPRCDVPLPEGKAPLRVGRLARSEHGAIFTPEAGIAIGVRRAAEVQSESVRDAIELASDARGEPDRLVLGSLRLEVMQRGEQLAVRVRDTQSALRTHFAGIECYPIRADQRVTAELEPYLPERSIELAYESGGVQSYRAPGSLHFTLGGAACRLDPVIDGARLFVLFGDPTNRTHTYGAGRFLYAALPQAGRVVLDFNQAFNPPCAFSPYASCPLPPPQNRLALSVEAGELRPRASAAVSGDD